MNPEQLVPCCCKVCAEQEIPEFFELSKLEKFVTKSRTKVTCDNVQDVSIAELLEGVVEFRPEPHLYTQEVEFEQAPGTLRSGEAFGRIEDKLGELLRLALEAEREVNIYGPVGAVTTRGDVHQKHAKLEIAANGKKPFLQRTSTLVTIAAGLVAIMLGVWQFFFKSEAPKSAVSTAQVQSARLDTSVVKAAQSDSLRQSAGKVP